jgi:FkbM family methyltransferase
MSISAQEHQNQPEDIWWGESFAEKVLLAGCRRTPFFRGKGRIFQLLAASLFSEKLHVRNSLGARLRIDPTDYIGRTISFEGAFEPKSLARAKAIMHEGGVFLDIGCNFGLYTMALGVLPGVKCIAIDGSFVALAKFQENLMLNPQIKAQVVNTALCDGNKLLCFEVPTDGNLGGTHVTDDEHHGGNHSQFLVSGVALERVLERLTPSRIKLLKIDVEGSEMSVFQGLDFNGPYRPENLIVECYLKLFPQATACFEYLQSKGYEAMTVEGKLIKECKDLPEENVWFRSTRQ